MSQQPCPICASSQTAQVLECIDHTVSHERFAVWHCDACTGRFTAPAPGPEAIGRYYQSDAYVSHSDTQKGLINWLYHRVRRRTLRGKLRLVQQATGKMSGRLLDVGAGTGAFAATMQQAGWRVTGLEPDPTAVANALRNHHLSLQPLDTLHTLPSQHFDAITLWHVLEHVHDLQGYVKRFRQLLAPGGRLFIAVPNYTSGDAAYYSAAWAAYDVPRHLYHFSPQSIEGLLGRHGFRLAKLEGMWYDAYYVSMLSEQYKNGRPNHLNAFLQGWRSNAAARKAVRLCSSVIYVAE